MFPRVVVSFMEAILLVLLTLLYMGEAALLEPFNERLFCGRQERSSAG